MRTHTLTSIAIAAAVIVAPGATPAQSGFPSGPITMIVSAPPRDNLTSIHRELADIAGAELGVEIKVENKPGSGGREGVEALIEAAPDGHTIAAVWNAPLTIAPHTGAASYTIDDIVPIMRTTAGAPLVVCVHPGFRADDSDDFVDHIEDNPGKYSYGTDGPGGIVELAGGRLFRPLGLDLKPVAFDGSAGVLRGFLGRKSDIYIGGVAGIIGQTKEGYAKCLFSTSEDPPMRFRDLDTLDDLDLEDQATHVWWALVAPKGTPPERIEVLAGAFRKAAGVDQFKYFTRRRYENVAAGTSEELADLIKTESDAFARIVKEIGLAK